MDRDTSRADHPLLAQLEIQTAVTRMLHAIDALDWQAFRAVFEPELRLDFTSLFPGRPETITIDALLSRWVPFAHGFDATQHLIGPVVLVMSDGRRATAEAHVHASHYLAEAEGGPLWIAAGHYEWTLERRESAWKIAGIIFRLLFQDGNRRLPELAPERGAAGRGRPLPVRARF
jgi:hypothetical protein